MSQQTVQPGGTAVAEPPAPFLPGGDDSAPDNRRKLILVGAALGVVVLVVAAFFLLKGGGSSGADSGLVPTHHVPRPSAAAPGAAAHPITLPKKVSAPVGRNPFKALYEAPVAAPAAAPSSNPQPSAPTTGTGTGTTTGTTTAATYHPVWIELRSVTATTATFTVGYSNGKTLRGVRYTDVKAPKAGAETPFAKTFALLGISGTGSSRTVLLKFGDGTPFRLDMTHNFMVVD